MALLVILLLTSGCVTFCSQIYREYYLVNVAKTWNDAQSYCRTSSTDLATIGNHDDMQKVVNMVEASGVRNEIWIGLGEPGPASWLWSVGETETSDGVVEYTNWDSLPSSTDSCGGMRSDGKWFSESCATALPYLCQDLDGGIYIVLENKTWIDAQQDCRLNNQDLTSARSQTENLVLQQIISDSYYNNSLSKVWIGLFRDEWKWSDQSSSSFRDWVIGQPNNDGDCALYSPSLKGFMDRDCAYLKPFICSKESRKKVYVTVVMMSSHDLNDLALSEAVLKQIQSKYQGASVQWRVKPNGTVFHKEEEKTVRGTY